MLVALCPEAAVVCYSRQRGEMGGSVSVTNTLTMTDTTDRVS